MLMDSSESCDTVSLVRVCYGLMAASTYLGFFPGPARMFSVATGAIYATCSRLSTG